MSAKNILITVLLIDTVIIFFVLSSVKPLNYFAEEGLITNFSFYHLLFCSYLAWWIFKERCKNHELINLTTPCIVWLIVSVGFVYLAVDEVKELHEIVDLNIHNVLNIKETALTDRIDDLIIGFYLFIAIWVFYFYRTETAIYKKIFPLFCVAFFLIFLMIVSDVVTNRTDILMFFINDYPVAVKCWYYFSLSEDVLKIYAEALLIGGFAYCLEIAKKINPI